LLRDIRRDPPRLVFGEQLAVARRPAPLAPPEMPGYSPASIGSALSLKKA
jgi:hypothetical protein